MAHPPMITAKALGAMPQFVRDVAGERRLAKAMAVAELPQHLIEEQAGYISEHSLATFVEQAARSTGQQNIGMLWSPYLSVTDYGAWGAYILSAQKLGNALRRATSVMRYHSTTDRAWLQAAGLRSQYCYEFAIPGHPAYADVAFSAIGVILSIFRAYLGQAWKPTAVLLDFEKVPNSKEVEDTFGCPVVWSAPRLAVEFKSALLLAERKCGDVADGLVTIEDIARERLGGPPETTVGQVVAIARHQLHHKVISIDATARALGIGCRTLQRKLEDEGAQFRRIITDVKVSRAKELLSSQSIPIAEIASALGYETANNFSRAFKNATGVSPSEHRGSRHKRL
ncbi:AraC family transcriptional regulator ligand-binding domain-containing protein [Tropicimonas sp. S265A]|uniref:AraC family transcriptional regulator ligand-binding domain-containing protein n=1 Tax=Tropicimonas sp. S265A TaxID=3415134 RepID=UPI003C7A0692